GAAAGGRAGRGRGATQLNACPDGPGPGREVHPGDAGEGFVFEIGRIEPRDELRPRAIPGIEVAFARCGFFAVVVFFAPGQCFGRAEEGVGAVRGDEGEDACVGDFGGCVRTAPRTGAGRGVADE